MAFFLSYCLTLVKEITSVYCSGSDLGKMAKDKGYKV